MKSNLKIYRFILSVLLLWVVVGIVVATFTSYFFNWPTLRTWGGTTEMALNTATSLLLLAASMLLRTGKQSLLRDEDRD